MCHEKQVLPPVPRYTPRKVKIVPSLNQFVKCSFRNATERVWGPFTERGRERKAMHRHHHILIELELSKLMGKYLA